jgi:hypothetical protein
MAGALGASIGGSLGWSANSRTVQRSDACHTILTLSSRRDNRLDLTDQYVFRGETGTVFVLDVNSSAAGPNAPQGFHPDARYEIKIYTDGSAPEDRTDRVTFGPPDQAGEQAVALHLLTGSDAYDDDATELGELRHVSSS